MPEIMHASQTKKIHYLFTHGTGVIEETNIAPTTQRSVLIVFLIKRDDLRNNYYKDYRL